MRFQVRPQFIASAFFLLCLSLNSGCGTGDSSPAKDLSNSSGLLDSDGSTAAPVDDSFESSDEGDISMGEAVPDGEGFEIGDEGHKERESLQDSSQESASDPGSLSALDGTQGFDTATDTATETETGGDQGGGLSGFVPEGYVLVWEDDFEGPEIDSENWVVASLRDPLSGDIVPGAVGDHLLNYHYAGYITEEDTFIEEGALVLRNQKRSYQGQSPAGSFGYTSGWVMSMHRIFFNKGYVEVRAQFPSGDKVWPALWLISEELQWCPEWDMWEYFGFRDDLGSPYDNMGTHLCYDAWPDQKWKSNFLSSFDLLYDCEAWHLYGFEWTESEARWFLDGALVHTVSASSLGANQGLWPDEDMYIVLNNGQRSASPDENTLWPNALKIDFIRLYQKGSSDSGAL